MLFKPLSTHHLAELSSYPGLTVTRNMNSRASFGVFTAVSLRIPFFWDITLRRRTCNGCPTFWMNSRPLKMKALYSFERFEKKYPVTQRHISAEQLLWIFTVFWWGVMDTRVTNGRSTAAEIIISCEGDWIWKYWIKFKFPSRPLGTHFSQPVATCMTDGRPLSASSYFPSMTTKLEHFYELNTQSFISGNATIFTR
jgi:hypothetical protein